jgi:hypothetical protein
MSVKPIIEFLREWLPVYFPVLTTPGHGLHPTGVGGYARRGRYHPTGRAADIFLIARDPYERRVGDALFELFIRKGTDLGVDHVIWNEQIWSRSRGGPRPYRGSSPHRTHIHVFFTPWGAELRPCWLLPYFDDILVGLGEGARA